VEPRRRAIRWQGSPLLSSDEPLPLIPPGHVLLRMTHAAWTGVEEAARSFSIVPRYGVVMGASGVGRPLEAAGAAPPPYRLAAPVRAAGWLPGLDSDGLLADYAIAPLDALEEATGEPLAALSLPAAMACHAVSLLNGEGAASLLVIGGGVTGYMVALLAAEQGLRVTLYTMKKLGCPRGCDVRQTLPGGAFDAVYAAHPSGFTVGEAVRRARPWMLLHSPYAPPRISNLRDRLLVVMVEGGGGGCWRRLLRRHSGVLGRYVVKTRGLTVPPPLGESALAYVFSL